MQLPCSFVGPTTELHQSLPALDAIEGCAHVSTAFKELAVENGFLSGSVVFGFSVVITLGQGYAWH